MALKINYLHIETMSTRKIYLQKIILINSYEIKMATCITYKKLQLTEVATHQVKPNPTKFVI